MPSTGFLTTACHHLTSKEDRATAHPRMEHHLPDENTMACQLTSMEEDEEDAEECLPTALLDEDVWMEEPVPERHLCIHENSQHDLCPYPCPYSLNQLHLAENNAPQYMDLSDIFKFPNVMTSASDEDIPSLEDILKL